ncbi:hypothetical protein EV363DRAFT_1182170 [Boletus edulis]|nr:hypothetical protein EV363DRAFT_1182170 [Boletus edulis]
MHTSPLPSLVVMVLLVLKSLSALALPLCKSSSATIPGISQFNLLCAVSQARVEKPARSLSQSVPCIDEWHRFLIFTVQSSRHLSAKPTSCRQNAVRLPLIAVGYRSHTRNDGREGPVLHPTCSATRGVSVKTALECSKAFSLASSRVLSS